MHRTKESEVNELNRKYSALHTAPLEALYADFPDGAERPPDAIRIYRHEHQQQDFQRPGRPPPPPPMYDHGKLKQSIDRFFRTICLHLFFSEITSELNDSKNISPKGYHHNELKLPSSFNPPMPSNLEFMHNIVTDHILTHKPTEDRKRNMSNAEFTAMFNLKDNENIVIKKADKGSNTVVMNKSDYIKEGERQLSNITFYRETNRNLTKRHKQIIDRLLTSCLENEEITKRAFDYLTAGRLHTSIFYMLPKIHKDVKNPPGRPIMSSVDSPTERISQLLDLILKLLIVLGRHTRFYQQDPVNKIV